VRTAGSRARFGAWRVKVSAARPLRRTAPLRHKDGDFTEFSRFGSIPCIASVIDAREGSTKLQETVMKKAVLRKVKLPTLAIKDSQKVAIGGYNAMLPVRRAPRKVADSGAVCIGGYRSTF